MLAISWGDNYYQFPEEEKWEKILRLVGTRMKKFQVRGHIQVNFISQASHQHSELYLNKIWQYDLIKRMSIFVQTTRYISLPVLKEAPKRFFRQFLHKYFKV